MPTRPLRTRDSLRTQASGLRTDIDEQVDRFLNYLAAEKGLAANSLAAYGRDLAAFVDHLERRRVAQVQAILPGDVVSFLDGLQRRCRVARAPGARAGGGGGPVALLLPRAS